MKKIKVSAVSYLNTKPLLYGLIQNDMEKKIELELDIPSVCADKLLDGRVQMALIPVAVIPQLKEAHIVSDFCIGSKGAVRTVAIYSDSPMEEIEELYLDFHSRTSVQLAKILLREYWKKEISFIPAKEGFINQIGRKRAALVIGDRTIGLKQKHKYTYDLGQAWFDHTGLPFVYATWVSTQKLPADFLKEFNAALASGIANIPKLIYLLPSPDPSFDLKEYFSHNISYELDSPKRKALDLFLSKIRSPQMEAI